MPRPLVPALDLTSIVLRLLPERAALVVLPRALGLALLRQAPGSRVIPRAPSFAVRPRVHQVRSLVLPQSPRSDLVL
jgi:hypothetical protein